MSYCTLDEAFGSPFQKEVELKKCSNKKVRSKINCNEKKNRFDVNVKDINTSRFNPRQEYESYNPYEYKGLIGNSEEMEINDNSNSSYNIDLESEDYNSFNSCAIEHFSNSNENVNSNSNKKNKKKIIKIIIIIDQMKFTNIMKRITYQWMKIIIIIM